MAKDDATRPYKVFTLRTPLKRLPALLLIPTHCIAPTSCQLPKVHISLKMIILGIFLSNKIVFKNVFFLPKTGKAIESIKHFHSQ